MSYWNHFSDSKYERIWFCELAIGEKFRMDKFVGKRRRKDIIMLKTGEVTYEEFKSKKGYKFLQSAVEVSTYDKLK